MPETNLKFEFKIELHNNEGWRWTILNHKNLEVGRSAKSFETKQECKDDLKLLSTSIANYLDETR